MSQGSTIIHTSFCVAAACALATCGCCAAVVPSPRMYQPEFGKVMDGPIQLGGQRFGMQDPSACTSCGDRQRLQDYMHHARPYVAGPFAHPNAVNGYAAQQATIQPPHSKFHPVPTRPVFETQASYLPPQPIGVQLVPIPDEGFHAIMSDSHLSDSPPLLAPLTN